MGNKKRKSGRKRAAIILLNDEKILIIRRFKNGKQYFVIPGGGVKKKETPKEAALREMKEETNLDVVIERKFHVFKNEGNPEYYYLSTRFSGTMQFGGPELKKINENNLFHLEWISFTELVEINLYPDEIKQKILQELAHNS